MTSQSLEDIYGDTTVDPDMAIEFMKWWFKPSDITSIVGMSDGTTPEAMTYNRDTLIKYIGRDWDKLTGSGTNVYFVTATTNAERRTRNTSSRPKKQDFKSVRGVWVDLDCKEGAFPTPEAVDEFIAGLDPQPGAIVKTGSGGAHLYWRIKDPAKVVVDEVGLRWWSYIQSLAPEGVEVDRLTDVKTRLLRLTGSTRWSKKGEEQKAHPVTVEYTGAKDLNADDVLLFSDESYPEALAEAKERRKAEDRVSASLNGIASRLGPWGLRTIMADIDSMVNELITWRGLLEAHGWTWLGNNGDSDIWQRPGSDQKSAYTCHEGDETKAMSLFSESPDTGLLDLKENDVPLSKWRVLLRLSFNDNVDNALDWIAENAE